MTTLYRYLSKKEEDNGTASTRSAIERGNSNNSNDKTISGVSSKKNLFRRYHKFPQTKLWLDSLALASLDTRPGQSPHEAGYLAWLGPAYFCLALAGSRPQARPSTTL